LTHFTSVLRKQFAGNNTFLKEANSYKRRLALRNSRQPSDHLTQVMHLAVY